MSGDPEAPVVDQPEVEQAPPEGTSAEESFTTLNPEPAEGEELTQEWLQKRHKEMQADYTRKRQADSETAKQRSEDLEFIESLRSDRDTQKAVLEQLQELLTESEVETEAQPQDALAQKVAELEAAQQQRSAQELAGNIVSHVEQLAKDASITLDEEDLRAIFDRATAGEKIDKATTENAFKAFSDRDRAKQDKWLKAYLDSKKPSSTVVPPGQSAQETPDLSKSDERIRRFAAILEGR